MLGQIVTGSINLVRRYVRIRTPVHTYVATKEALSTCQLADSESQKPVLQKKKKYLTLP